MIIMLIQVHSAPTAESIFPLDMAPNSVDDQYRYCRNRMAKLVETTLLPAELRNSEEFNKAWQKGKLNSMAPKDKLSKNHLIAIYVYTDYLYAQFNMADRNDRKKYIDRTHKWYSLHFLLTEAIQILNSQKSKCHLTYRGVNRKFNTNVLNTEVRFGSFTSSSFNKKVSQSFSNKSCFEIKTCYGAVLTKYSKFPGEEELLIPPYEKFKVIEVKTKSTHKYIECETVFVLKSSGVRSYLNCALFK